MYSEAQVRRLLPRLIDRAVAGEDVVVERNGRAVARLTQLSEGARQLRFGVLAGEVTSSDDFDEPLLADEIARFEGR